MGAKPHEELMSSFKELYVSGEYSDLTIIGRGRQYQVHKAIVCPRSEYFASASRKASAAEAQSGSFSLTEDDPAAVDMVFDYLYHLDYPVGPIPIGETVNGVNGLNGHVNGHANGHMNGHMNGVLNGDAEHSPKTNGHTGPVQDISPFSFPDHISEAAKDDSLSIVTFDDDATSKKDKDKKKKKKKKGGVSKPNGEQVNDEVKEPPIEKPESHEEPSPEEAVAVVETPVAEVPVVEVPVELPASTNLVTHAKVYALSKKYKIEGLRALALEKFEVQVQECWATEEFLQAAKVVYESTLDDDVDIRNAVTTTLYHHPELLDKKETQDVIKGLALGFDLLMRVRSSGFW